MIKGEIVSFCITTGNVDDRNKSVIELLSKDLFGKLFGDRGYISKKIFEALYNNRAYKAQKYNKFSC
jgi:hypothetical protein